MGSILDIVLVVLLAATLFQALRLERALGVLRRDRAVIGGMVSEFNASTRQAEDGIGRLRDAVDGAGRQISQQTDAAAALNEGLALLNDRGNRLADRLDSLARAGRPPDVRLPPPSRQPSAALPPPRQPSPPPPRPVAAAAVSGGPSGPEPRVRSQAERDLLKALARPR